MKKIHQKLLRLGLLLLAGVAALGTIGVVGLYLFLEPQLLSVESLREVQFQVPLRVFTHDGKLIAEFGEMKRTPLKFDEIPPLMVKAFISAEDDRFFEHSGVDFQGLLRAAVVLVATGEKAQGGSTITMQVARNFFLSSEKTYLRKLNEILLAMKIDRELSKEEVMELYLNKIYLGNRAYGIGSAAQVYYGKEVKDLSLAQIAMIAGLPKAPSKYNPVVNPERSKLRRNYVLDRMAKLGYIEDQEATEAKAESVTARLFGLTVESEAPYVAEMVRQELTGRFGDEAYTQGYRVYTTLDAADQKGANDAVRRALLDYDRRHGYRGPVEHVAEVKPDDPESWHDLLDRHGRIGNLLSALVLTVGEKSAAVFLDSGETAQIPWEEINWARRYVDENTVGPTVNTAADVLQVGDIVYVEKLGTGLARLSQIPAVAGALVAMDPNDGALRALVGGFDFYQSKYNRITQAERQPGSSFKPFIYSAALEKGYTPAHIINDAPVVFEDPALEASWRPENYTGKFYGPTRLRVALINSRNLVSIRLLQSIGIIYTVDYATKFGFNREKLPRNLSLALGSGAVTPLDLVRAHGVFANGGYLVKPYFIERVEDGNGQVLWKAEPEIVCPDCAEGDGAMPTAQETVVANEQVSQGAFDTNSAEAVAAQRKLAPLVIPKQNAFLTNSMMRDVIKEGTGRKAMSLGRNDLAGKTGTTNDQYDAWFVGFNRDLVAVTWVGFDDPKPLGSRETGSGAALPMWIDFAAVALQGKPEHLLETPPGLVTVRIDPETGLLAGADNPNAIFETFRADDVPTRQAESPSTTATKTQGEDSGTTDAPETIF